MSDPLQDRRRFRIQVTDRYEGNCIGVTCPNCESSVRMPVTRTGRSLRTVTRNDAMYGYRYGIDLQDADCLECGSTLTAHKLMGGDFDIEVSGISTTLNPTDEPPDFDTVTGSELFTEAKNWLAARVEDARERSWQQYLAEKRKTR